ncbi:futalosine hydrolase [Mangrovactinospora gilvigrisea]|uniref:Futalosine hydrolase n=1 Tax=Mangrovactinospora gilvigrisea TaxID=1428644 RepID=A0A1J7BEI4_9ACTN|nr:futalosine hydrolase [Mangrovactinospora gilvigrisea]OIV37046.1 futalosine hydrolase [Mangrovactinospora gilvigrisea]
MSSAAAPALVVTAVEAERAAVLGGLPDGARVHAVGVGPAGAAAGTAKLLAEEAAAGRLPRLLLCAGIGGGFAPRARIGDLVVADAIVAADLGAEAPQEPGGFLPVDALGFGTGRRLPPADAVAEAADLLGAGALTGTVLTVTTATGSAATAAELTRRHPAALAEAMEGFGVAEAAALFGVPVLEIRAVSNAVGPRDRGAWRIKEALEALRRGCARLAPMLTP